MNLEDKIDFSLYPDQKIIDNYPISIYVHWPFCLSKCPYCDFNSHVAKNIDKTEWIESYLTELNYFKNYFHNRKIRSIYFGGGTPSLMDPEIVYEIINYLKTNSIFDNNIEITLEANPTSSEYNKFKAFRNAGINRVSIGVQSLIKNDLKFLGREHSVDDAENAIQMAREIFQRYSFDLIYARPNQTLESWELELRKAMNLAGDHISLYQLTIEKGTKFYQMYQKKEFYLPPDDDSNELYFLTDKILSEYDFNKYEVSNYARNDKGSIHNMCYWNYDDYLGIGPGAHSRLRQKFGNYYGLNQIYSPQSWLKSVKTNGNGIQKSELLSYKDAASELILMGLRLKCGIDQKKAIDKLESKIEDLIETSTLNFLKNEGLIEYDEKYFRATNNGWRILDYLIGKIIDGFKSYV